MTEYAKGVLIATGSTPILVRSPLQALYEIHHIHYQWRLAAGVSTTEGFRMGLSTKLADQVPHTGVLTADEIYLDPNIYYVIQHTFILQNIEGMDFVNMQWEIPLAKPLVVPYIALKGQHFWTTDLQIGVQLDFDTVKVTAVQYAHATAQAGGQI